MEIKDMRPELEKLQRELSLGSIVDEANRSLVQESKPRDPSMGHRTRKMAKRNERARRLLGLVDV